MASLFAEPQVSNSTIPKSHWIMLTCIFCFATSSFSIFMDSESILHFELKESIVDFTLQRITIQGLQGSIRDLCAWNMCLTKDELLSLITNGTSFIVRDFLADIKFASTFFNFSQLSNVALNNGKPFIDFPNPFCSNGGGTKLNVYTLILDCCISRVDDVFELLSFPSSSPDLYASIPQSRKLIVKKDGSFSSPYTSVASKIITFGTHSRLVVVCDLAARRWSIYCNSLLIFEDSAESLSPDDLLIHNDLFAIDGPRSIDHVIRLAKPSQTFSIHSMQLRSVALSPKDVEVVFQQQSCGPFRRSDELCSSLRLMGIPKSWCKVAVDKLYGLAISHKINRWELCDWVLSNQQELIRLDNERILEEKAAMLSCLGYPKDLCVQALRSASSSQGSPYGAAIDWLLSSHPEVSGNSEQQSTNNNLFTSMNPNDNILLSGVEVNGGSNFRILNSCDEEFDSSTTVVSSKRPHRQLFPLTKIKDSELCVELVKQCQVLTVLRCRKALLWYISLLQSRSQVFSDLGLLRKFLRLMNSCKLYGSMELIREHFIFALLADSQGSFSLQLGRFLVQECLYHMIGTCIDASTSNQGLIKKQSEKLVLSEPNSELGLWLLEIFVFVEIESNVAFRKGSLLNKQLVNALFQMIVANTNENRVSYLRILTKLLRDSSYSADDWLSQNHDRVTSLRNYMFRIFRQNRVDWSKAFSYTSRPLLFSRKHLYFHK
jgi:hypothetical protein